MEGHLKPSIEAGAKKRTFGSKHYPVQFSSPVTTCDGHIRILAVGEVELQGKYRWG